MNRFLRFTKMEIANIVVALIGVMMILFSSLPSGGESKTKIAILQIVGNIGIGVFPSGVIGFILERMQIRNRNIEKTEMRRTVLRYFLSALHEYLNVVCSEAIKQNSELKDSRVFDITKRIVIQGELQPISAEESESLSVLVQRMEEAFGTNNPFYIVTDVFESDELTHFGMLIENGKKLVHSIKQEKNPIESRNSFLSYIQSTCLSIPECNGFNEMISDGDNIFIPQK